ncbi:hypothetical protein QNH14_13635 [Apirhabdus apintestini]|uniref:hypothetical protein n=1 Tax=Erwinia sp. HR93 TaxID=3094840 RepID=UPI002ADEC953|nr:hypothetical protein [Erwinia sp. HR93]MEA1063893.1 hypothetical protein [Erwinia sp. HR93]WPM84078.1 hypothetical protein QNH14_13635 [Enterobacteriaceae bacterium CA-0114]
MKDKLGKVPAAFARAARTASAAESAEVKISVLFYTPEIGGQLSTMALLKPPIF